jgi:hypothetical protein
MYLKVRKRHSESIDTVFLTFLLKCLFTGGRRRQNQAQNPSQIRNAHEYRCKLVLPLRLHATPRTQEFQEMQRVRGHVPFDMHAFRPRFLRYEHGDGESDPQGHGTHQELANQQTSPYYQAGTSPITRTAWIWIWTGNWVLPARETAVWDGRSWWTDGSHRRVSFSSSSSRRIHVAYKSCFSSSADTCFDVWRPKIWTAARLPASLCR